MTANTNNTEKQKIITFAQIMRAVIMLIIFCIIIFLSAGTIKWWEGWVYVINGILIWTIFARMHIAHLHPDLITERASYNEKEDTKPFDRYIMPFIAIIGPLSMLVIAGLDKRFGWSGDVELWIKIAALVAFNLGAAFGHWAMIVNRFFAAIVRIQTDRGHHVIDTGPYAIVRHPGYVSGLIANIATPLLLGSWWAFIPTALTIIGYIVRTALEDRTLRAELPGYEEYTGRTRYRLLPFVW